MTEFATGPGGGPSLTPPQALDAERSVLAAMMLDEGAIGRAIEMIEASAFYRTSHAKLFDALVGLYNARVPADLITVAEELKKRGDLEAVGGPQFLAQIMEYATTSANLEQHIKIVYSKAILRQLIKATTEIQQQAYAGSEETAEVLDRAEARIFAITDQRIREGFTGIRELLKPTFDNIQKLFERKVQVTGVPSGWDDLDKLTSGWQPGDLVILAGRPSMGKCVSGRTLIVDPASGQRLSIEEAVQKRLSYVHGLDASGAVQYARVEDWIESGTKPCFRLTTRLGRSIEVTQQHPFLTIEGWTPLDELSPGDFIAVPRIVPTEGRDTAWSYERVRLLAYLIAEGGLTHDVPGFTTADPDHRADFERCLAAEFPKCQMKAQSDGIGYRMSRRQEFRSDRASYSGYSNPLTGWLAELGLWGKKSEAKSFPPIVWTWDYTRQADFLKILFSCDGTIYRMSGYPRIEFTVASEDLARDVYHLLVRFGIVSKLWKKTAKSWRVELTAPEEVSRYQRLIGWHGEKTDRFPESAFDPEIRTRHACSGGAPQATWKLIQASAARAGITVTELARRAGDHAPRGYNSHAGRAIRRQRLERFATALADPTLLAIASEDLYWDEIVEIEPVGEMKVFDLCVPDGSNFIANDICVHNSSAAVNMAENAAIRHNVPVAIFSLEMSKEQLAMRLLCSQSEVSLQKVRTGYLGNEDWPRLTTGAGLLTSAPILIDDSPSLSVLELRAKCRRLRAEKKLGLVVVDYLQLMRGSTPAENRVQEISQISRGLKGLAKELEVPIIALSQLSRAVEQRGGSGRPQLSDLRDSGCLTADARVLRADTGAEVTMGDLLASGERNIPVWTVDESFRLVEGTMTHVFPSGEKEVFEMRLASGRSIKASANHPFLTLDGWRRLDQLNTGTRLAVLKRVPARALEAEWRVPGTEQHETLVVALKLEEPRTAESDLLWDEITTIWSLGVQPVFDATVPGTHNFIANGIVTHNSIEQDADVVLFVYREVVYKPDTAEPGKAQLIIAKQRNGPTDDVDMTFLRECTKFVPYSPVMSGETEPGF
jgi:replicative DNA helicase